MLAAMQLNLWGLRSLEVGVTDSLVQRHKGWWKSHCFCLVLSNSKGRESNHGSEQSEEREACGHSYTASYQEAPPAFEARTVLEFHVSSVFAN